MKEINITKDYFIEGSKVKKDTKIKMLQENEDPYIIPSNEITDETNKISLSQEEFNSLIEPLLKEVRILGYLDGSTTPLEVEKNVISFIRQKYIRYFELPSLEEIKNYIINRSQSFAK
jgi:hypothetical protein